MKKVLLMVLAGVLAGMPFVPARAADDEEKKFEFTGEIRARYEYLNNYLDLTDNVGASNVNDDQMSIAPYRVMLGITGNFSKNVSAHVDFQSIGHFGDQFNPSQDNPFHTFPGAIGQADAAYQFATQGLALYQGYVDVSKIGGSDFGIRFGRAEHTYGTELFLGDNDYYNGQSFDGFRGMWNHGHNDLNVFYYKISEENCLFNCGTANGGGPGASADTNLWGATYDWKFKKWGTVGGNVLIVQDLGGDGPVGFPDSKLMTYGARWNRGMYDADNNLNMFDWDIEYDMQSGDAGEPFGGPKTDLGGWVGEGWFAFNFKAGDTHGRAHIGTLITSGDKFTSTTKNEGFVTLYGDFHANNRFGDLDWVDQFGPSNITDYNVGYEHWIGAHYVMFAYHMFQETESNTATIGAHTSTIGNEIDLKYGYKYSKNLSFEAFVGQATPDDKYSTFYGLLPPGATKADPVQRASVQAKLNW
jgi:hypothetical protein